MDWYLDRTEARVRRARRDLTMTAVARAIGVSLTQVSHWEAGTRPIAEARVRDVVRAYGGPQSGLLVRRAAAVAP